MTKTTIEALPGKWRSDRTNFSTTEDWSAGYNRAKNEDANELEAALAALSQEQTPQPEAQAVAWLTPESIAHLERQNGPAKVDAWNCASGNERVPVFTRPTHDGGGVTEAVPGWGVFDDDGRMTKVTVNPEVRTERDAQRWFFSSGPIRSWKQAQKLGYTLAPVSVRAALTPATPQGGE